MYNNTVNLEIFNTSQASVPLKIKQCRTNNLFILHKTLLTCKFVVEVDNERLRCPVARGEEGQKTEEHSQRRTANRRESG